jgi:uncharacterized membrane protein HdeD (DUF308 family)
VETKVTRAGTTPSAPRNYSMPFGILLLAAGAAAFIALLLVGLRTVAFVGLAFAICGVICIVNAMYAVRREHRRQRHQQARTSTG